MFRKYYKSLNTHISPSEDLVNATKKKLYEEMENDTPKKSTKLILSFASFVFVIIVALVINYNPLKIYNEPPQKEIKIETSLVTGTHSSSVLLSKGELNFIEGNTFESETSKINLDTSRTYKEIWDMDMIFKYLGKDPRPSYIPKDLQLYNAGGYTQDVYLNNDKSIAYDNFNFTYLQSLDVDTYNPKARRLNIEVSKGKLPITCVGNLPNSSAKSNINGHEILVEYSKVDYGPYDENHNPSGYYDSYYAQFIYDDIGYILSSENLTQEEFINVLLSILK